MTSSNDLLHILDLEGTYFDSSDYKFSDFAELGRYSYTNKTLGFPLRRDSTDFVLPLDSLLESQQTKLSTTFSMKQGSSSFWYVYPSYHSNEMFVGNFNLEPNETDLQAAGKALTGVFSEVFNDILQRKIINEIEIAGLNTGKDTRDAISTAIFGETLPDNVFVFDSSCFKVPTITVKTSNHVLPKACVGVLVGMNWEALYAHPEYDVLAKRLLSKLSLLNTTFPKTLHKVLFNKYLVKFNTIRRDYNFNTTDGLKFFRNPDTQQFTENAVQSIIQHACPVGTTIPTGQHPESNGCDLFYRSLTTATPGIGNVKGIQGNIIRPNCNKLYTDFLDCKDDPTTPECKHLHTLFNDGGNCSCYISSDNLSKFWEQSGIELTEVVKSNLSVVSQCSASCTKYKEKCNRSCTDSEFATFLEPCSQVVCIQDVEINTGDITSTTASKVNLANELSQQCSIDSQSTDTGGPDTGGSDTGGSDTGGSDTGGSDTGGSDTGGSDTGGSDGTSIGSTGIIGIAFSLLFLLCLVMSCVIVIAKTRR